MHQPVRASRRLALSVLCLGQLMIILDGSIVNVALPSIQADLGFTGASLAWVVNAYLVPFGGLLLLFGRLGDILAARHVFRIGLFIFTLASLACGLAHSPVELLSARFAQGIGGAMASAVTLGMVAGLFRLPRERTGAMGVYSFVQPAGGSLGLVGGGVLTQLLNWHWIFLVNIPIGALALAVSVPALTEPERPGVPRAGRPDVAGALLATAGLVLLIYAIVESGDQGWTSPGVIAAAAAAMLLLAGFGLRQARAANPLVPARLLHHRVLLALACQGMLIFAMFAFQYLAVLYLHKVLLLDDLHTGLAMLPVSLAIGAASLGAAPRLITRFGSRPVLLAGLAAICAGLAWLALVPAHGTYSLAVLPALLPLGIGFGAAMPALAGLAMSSAGPADSGIASGLFNTMQQVGGALGLAILSSIAAVRTAALVASGANDPQALSSGYGLAFGIAACVVAAALVLALLGLRAAPLRREPLALRATRRGPGNAE